MKGPSFVDLRRLADWLDTTRAAQVMPLAIERLIDRLGRGCAPLLARALRDGGTDRREAARRGLALVAVAGGPAADARERVIDALHAIADDPGSDDDAKVCALGLLAELGERGEARFTDPMTIQRRSALALAAQLGSAAEVASAADLMMRRLGDGEIAEMLEVMSDAAPHAAGRLASELAGRLDASQELQARVVPIAAQHGGDVEGAGDRRGKRERPTQAAVLVDAAARLVVVASRKLRGEKRWRRWAVLIGASGRIEDCLHTDEAGLDGDAAPLIANLVADGYQVASNELDHARAIVAAAARLTASDRSDPRPERAPAERRQRPKGATRATLSPRTPQARPGKLVGTGLVPAPKTPSCDRAPTTRSTPAPLDVCDGRDAPVPAVAPSPTTAASPSGLSSAYYLGRDLLGLGDAHLDGRPRVDIVAQTVGRAIDLIATGDVERALAILARCDGANADVASAIASCRIAQGRFADAVPSLLRAIEAERDWPLHHWNLAAALHELGDGAGSHDALLRFVACSGTPSGLDADPAQPSRLDLARRLLAAHERTARVTQLSNKPRRRRARTRRLDRP